MMFVAMAVCWVVLALTVVAWGQDGGDEGVDQVNRPGMEQIDRLNKALEKGGRIFVWVAIGAALIVILKIAGPLRMIDSAGERLVKRAVRDVDELIQRIEKEAETTTEDAKKEPAADEGVLAGMMEMAEFTEADQVPSYVLTVNDLMLDNVRTTLKRLRRFDEGDARRYRDYMFSVIAGMKTLTEQSIEGGVPSGLAVDLKDYFADDHRYKVWRKLLSRYARKGSKRELADTFLIFMRNLKEGRPLAIASSSERPEASSAEEESAVPNTLSEETLPAIQQAAAREARNLRSVIQAGKVPDTRHAWQFEFVQRQRQMHRREEAQRMLSVFLNCERKSLLQVTKVRMLPCRTWGHVLHMLGVESTEQLHGRARDKLLTIQEIIILEKAFLQTFARRESLGHVYGQDAGAELMMDEHLPEIQREALGLLRQAHQTQRSQLDRATETLNDEETPQNARVKKLIEHYVHRRHEPPNARDGPGGGPRQHT
jgi:hypothetical protein